MSTNRLPSGRVTFVFTDIEGSTRLLRTLGDDYDAALDQHRDLLRQAWRRHGGYEVSTAGDSFFVAFADTESALLACAEGQRLLQTANWPDGREVRVRMGVHSGIASPRGNDYVALAVHQAARVMSAAHGMQVLVSEETAAQAPPGMQRQLKLLGRYRLRDFEQPVRLFELVSPDLASVSRAIRAMPADGHNLARPLDTFIGRGAQQAEVAGAVTPGQLVTLVGPGGVGKTRLALEVGLDLTADWRDGVWLIDLAPIRDPALIVDELLETLGVPSPPGADPRETLLGALADANRLLLLDNCEHLIDECAAVAEAVLQRCPEVGILATSRTPLGIHGERVVRVDPLDLPGPGASLAEALATPAVQLLLNRTAARGRPLDVSADAIDEVVELVRRLDGLPLALELAAARLNVVGLHELIEALEAGGDELAVRGLRQAERHGSLRRLLDWSYEELNEAEQTVLRRLSVFRGSFSLPEFSETVCGGLVDAAEAPDLLWSLVDKSLVLADLRADETRYRLLATVRDYAATQLETDERRSALLALSEWMLHTVGPAQQRDRGWLGRVAAEADNMREVVSSLAPVDPERAQVIACAIGRYHDLAHTFRTGTDELTRWAAMLDAATPARAVLLATLADLHLRLGEVEAAASALDEAERVRAAAGPLPDWDDAAVDRVRGELAMRSGEPERALEVAREALDGPLSERGQARMWNLLGIAAVTAGDLERAEAAFRSELALCEALDDVVPLAADHGNLAEVALRRDDQATAAREQLQCLRYAQELGLPVMIAYSLIVSARLGAVADPRTAVELHTRAEALLGETGAALYDDDQRLSDAMLSTARGTLGESNFEHAVQAGLSTDLPLAIERAEAVLQELTTSRM